MEIQLRPSRLFGETPFEDVGRNNSIHLERCPSTWIPTNEQTDTSTCRVSRENHESFPGSHGDPPGFTMTHPVQNNHPGVTPVVVVCQWWCAPVGAKPRISHIIVTMGWTSNARNASPACCQNLRTSQYSPHKQNLTWMCPHVSPI